MQTFLRSLSVIAFGCWGIILAPAATAQSSEEPASLLAFAPAANPLNPQLLLRSEADPAGLDSTAARISLVDLRVMRLAPDAPGVVVYWTTNSQSESSAFVLERREDDGAGYRSIALVPGRPGTDGRSYTFVDAYNTSDKPSVYRLRQKSSKSHSGLVSVAIEVPGALPGPPELPDPEEVLISVATP